MHVERSRYSSDHGVDIRCCPEISSRLSVPHTHSSSAVYLLIVIVLYLPAAVWAVSSYRYQINPDGVSYISIAQKYLAGDFYAAINAYWSPLYSWLLMPFLMVGLPPLLATKVLAAFVGIGTIAAAWKLGDNLSLQAGNRVVLCSTLIPVLLYLGTTVATPDLLSTLIVLLYIAYLTQPNFWNRPAHGIVVGLVGGLAYLAKAYVMWFFLIHFLTHCIYTLIYLNVPKRRALQVASTALVTFSLVAGTWITLLSYKYGKLTSGSAGAYNHALRGPTWPDHPMHTDGLLTPPNVTAVSIWEDPTYLNLPKWNPMATSANSIHQVKLILHNSQMALAILQTYSVLAMAVLLISVMVAGTAFDVENRRPMLILLLGICLYPLGYLLLHLDLRNARYLAPMAILLLILAFSLVDILKVVMLGRYRRIMVIIALATSFTYMPLHHLLADRDTGEDIYNKSVYLATVLPKGSNIASDEQWHDTLSIAFHCGLTYFGQVKPGCSPANHSAELKRHQIDFFLVWGNSQSYPFTKEWPEVSGARIEGLHIYQVRQESL